MLKFERERGSRVGLHQVTIFVLVASAHHNRWKTLLAEQLRNVVANWRPHVRPQLPTGKRLAFDAHCAAHKRIQLRVQRGLVYCDYFSSKRRLQLQRALPDAFSGVNRLRNADNALYGRAGLLGGDGRDAVPGCAA